MRVRKNKQDRIKTNIEMVDLNPIIAITILNINYVNIPYKRKRSSDRIKSKIQIYID